MKRCNGVHVLRTVVAGALVVWPKRQPAGADIYVVLKRPTVQDATGIIPGGIEPSNAASGVGQRRLLQTELAASVQILRRVGIGRSAEPKAAVSGKRIVVVDDFALVPGAKSGCIVCIGDFIPAVCSRTYEKFCPWHDVDAHGDIGEFHGERGIRRNRLAGIVVVVYWEIEFLTFRQRIVPRIDRMICLVQVVARDAARKDDAGLADIAGAFCRRLVNADVVLAVIDMARKRLVDGSREVCDRRHAREVALHGYRLGVCGERDGRKREIRDVVYDCGSSRGGEDDRVAVLWNRMRAIGSPFCVIAEIAASAIPCERVRPR